MRKKIAVATIHGIGTFGARPGDSSDLIYSAEMNRLVRRTIDRKNSGEFDRSVAWREIFYSDITEENQRDYFERVRDQLDFDWMRKFVIANLGDSSAYQPARPQDKNHKIYELIHARVEQTLMELEAEAEPGAPLILLAHSLGCHILSNHIWDLQHDNRRTAIRISNANTVAAFLTFGCNIPLFNFAYSFEQIFAISDPSTGLPDELRCKPWWGNYFDKDDILGYPLAPSGIGYRNLENDGALLDQRINVGGFLESQTPLAHRAYWRDNDVSDRISTVIKFLLDRI